MLAFKRFLFCLVGFSLCFACNPEKPTPQTVATPENATRPVKIQTEKLPDNSFEPFVLEEGIALKEILTSSALSLLVGEELMLIGEVGLSNGKRVAFDKIRNLLVIENQTPEFLLLDLNERIVKALKQGTALIKVHLKKAPQINALIKIEINKPAIDPTVAILNLEIE